MKTNFIVIGIAAAVLFGSNNTNAQINLGATGSATFRSATSVTTPSLNKALQTSTGHTVQATREQKRSTINPVYNTSEKTTSNVRDINNNTSVRVNTNHSNQAQILPVVSGSSNEMLSTPALQGAAGSESSVQAGIQEGISSEGKKVIQHSKSQVSDKSAEVKSTVKSETGRTTNSLKEKSAQNTVNSTTELKSDTKVSASNQ